MNWQGQFWASLKEAVVLPRPENEQKGLPIWRAVGCSYESAQGLGVRGALYQAHLGGAAMAYKSRIDTFRQSAEDAGFNSATYREYYPHINEGMKLTNGQGFPKQAFAQGQDPHSIVNVGDPAFIVEKLLYQHELFGHQRYIAQLDFGGVTMDQIKRNIDLIGAHILPQLKNSTASK